MPKKVNFIATGGTITCAPNAAGKLEPKLEAKDLIEISKGAGFDESKIDPKYYSPYKIDSQIFDIATYGKSFLEQFQKLDPAQDIIITTGTDTINWLAALVKNHEAELGFERKVIILSSIYPPIDEKGKAHVGKIMRAGFEMLAQDAVENGVYVAAAQNEEASEIRFYDVNTPLAKVAKYPKDDSAIIVGNVWHKAVYSADMDSSFSRESSLPSSPKYSNPLEAISANVAQRAVAVGVATVLEKKEEERLEQFVANCKMPLLPVLSQTSSEVIAGYFCNLIKDDIAVLEAGESWFDGDNLKSEYFDLIKNLTEKGVKLIINNRSIYNGEQFEYQLSKEKFSQISQIFSPFPNILPISHISSDGLYTKLAMTCDDLPSRLPKDMEYRTMPLGLKYIPHLPLVKNGLGNIRSHLPLNIVLEGLVGGVVPTTVLEVLKPHRDARQIIYSCGSNAVEVLDNSYATSSGADELKEAKIERVEFSAANQMQFLNAFYLSPNSAVKESSGRVVKVEMHTIL